MNRDSYTLGVMSPKREQELVDALVELGAIETQQGLHAEGVRAIQERLGCSLDEARAAFRELRVQGLVEETTEPGGEAVGHESALHFRWVRPA